MQPGGICSCCFRDVVLPRAASEHEDVILTNTQSLLVLATDYYKVIGLDSVLLARSLIFGLCRQSVLPRGPGLPSHGCSSRQRSCPSRIPAMDGIGGKPPSFALIVIAGDHLDAKADKGSNIKASWCLQSHATRG